MTPADEHDADELSSTVGTGPARVVGIGASAGGLEALEEFLGAVPPDTGLAYVVVQHLDPNQPNLLVELLGKVTPMPVLEVRDRMLIEPDHVYVIPPGSDLTVLGEHLHLIEPTMPRGLRLPIDLFFRSLALDRREHSIGVILSGTGSDGTLGVRAIKEAAGAAFVQAPETARFDGMPRSVLDAGLADVAAPAADLARQVLAFHRHVPGTIGRGLEPTEADQDGIDKVVILLRERCGHDFANYKKTTLLRRIERRMGLHQLAEMADYVHFVRTRPGELDLLFKELLIGVTSFFRDPEVWEQLRDEMIPELLARQPEGVDVRAWVPGCSTGEEAYSLAIAFREAVEQHPETGPHSLQIFATDLDPGAIATARAGIYPANIAVDVSPQRLERHFVEREDGSWRISSSIRESVVFAEQDVITDPPFTRVDLITCRNLLIYFDAELQRRIIRIFHYALRPGGVLVLGSAETCGAASRLFETLSGNNHIYGRLNGAQDASLEFSGGWRSVVSQGSHPTPAARAASSDLSALVTDLVVREWSPPAVLTTVEGDILYASSRTSDYLEPAVGRANMNIFNMVRDGLGEQLQDCFHRAVETHATATVRSVAIGTEPHGSLVDITVEPLDEPAALAGLLLIVFRAASPLDVALGQSVPPTGGDLDVSRDAIESARVAREQLHQTRKRMQVTQEELRSANEELQSTNEELQSTNEELSTSKEEMQSMNEELRTVNSELQAKVAELSQASDDMKNLLDSTDIAIVFLDLDLAIRRFTRRAADVFRLQLSDVGRAITDLASDLDYPGLAADARAVVANGEVHEAEIAAADDRWFHVRVIPYRTQDDAIDGVVLTFSDITAAKRLEHELRARHESSSAPHGGE